MIPPKISLSMPTGLDRGQYVLWCRQALTQAKSYVHLSKSHPCYFLEGAKKLSQLILPPPEVCEYVWTSIKKAKLSYEIEKVRKIYEKHRETLEESIVRNSLQWLSLPPLSFTPPNQELDSLPMSLASQTFIYLKNDNFDHPQAYWNGLTTCSCPKKSPASVDILMQTIADDLKPHQEAVIIDFGSGGCLPLLPLITRLTHLKTINLCLVDPMYSGNIQRSYLITSNGIQADKEVIDPIDSLDFPVVQFFRFCVMYLQKGQQLHVEVCPTTEIALEKLNAIGWEKNVPNVLYTIDPVRSIPFFRDFKQLAEVLIANTKNPLLYCLNLMAGSKLSLRIEPEDLGDALFRNRL